MKRKTREQTSPVLRIKPARYRVKSIVSGNALPHAVSLTMTTLRDGRARWTYTETFVRSQFPSRGDLDQVFADSIELIGAQLLSGMTIRRKKNSIVIQATTSRESFADAMVSEFMAWGGPLAKASLSDLFLGATSMILAGWSP